METEQAQPTGNGPGGIPQQQAGSSAYFDFVARALVAQAGELGRTWARARGSAPGSASGSVGQAGATPESAGEPSAAEDLVRALVAAAASGAAWQEPVMRAGWSAGTAAFHREDSLHQLLKELDSAVAIILRAAHSATYDYRGTATALDALTLARRFNDAASLVRLAAAGGYMRVMADDLRKRYRTIRHDLRNPLGTITTAVALMDDESLPEATRQHPRVRAMVARNARSMDAMISSVLGDSAARLPALALQTTTLRSVACAVRSDLRASVDRIDVVVGDRLPAFPLEAPGLELLLKAVVLAVAQAPSRTEILVDLEEVGARTATLVVRSAGGDDDADFQPELSFARDLVSRLGGRVVTEPGLRVLVEIPIEPLGAVEAATAAGSVGSARARPSEASARDAGRDVARERERPDGESRAL